MDPKLLPNFIEVNSVEEANKVDLTVYAGGFKEARNMFIFKKRSKYI